MDPYSIDEAAKLKLESGIALEDFPIGRNLLRMARAYAQQQSALMHPDQIQVPINTFIARKEDMSPNGRLRLFKEEDGDICVAIIEDDGTMADVQFCTQFSGGGKSPQTLKALNDLALAMMEDNKTSPARSADR